MEPVLTSESSTWKHWTHHLDSVVCMCVCASACARVLVFFKMIDDSRDVVGLSYAAPWRQEEQPLPLSPSSASDVFRFPSVLVSDSGTLGFQHVTIICTFVNCLTSCHLCPVSRCHGKLLVVLSPDFCISTLCCRHAPSPRCSAVRRLDPALRLCLLWFFLKDKV